MTTLPDDTSDLVARHLPPEPRAGDPCPDDATLLAFAEGSLPAGLRDDVERHVATCETCREAVGWAASAEETSTEVARPRAVATVSPWRRALAAAVVLAAAGVGLWRPWAGPSEASLVERIAAVSRQLVRESPERWGAFRVATAADLAQGERPVERGGVVLTAPRGVVLDVRPRFTWRGAGRAALTVRDGSGATPVRVEVVPPTSSPGSYVLPADGPALAEGAEYVAVVEVATALGEEQGRATFRVATARERDEAAAARREAEAIDPDVGALLYAQWALRRDLLVEAEAAAQRATADSATRPLARAVLDHIARRSGRP